MDRSKPPLISLVPPDRARKALAVVLSDRPRQDRELMADVFVAEASRGRLSLDGLLEARRQGRMVGAIFSQIEPGRTAVVWPPRLIGKEPRSTAAALLEATCQRLVGKSIVAAHAILSEPDNADDEMLRRGGFGPLARLFYLACGRESFPSAEPSGPLQFEAYSPASRDRLIAVIEATYIDTRDCPAMDGVRSIDDVLAGYQAIGEYSPRQWMIVRSAGRDVGCLLLADHGAQENMELVYMGVAASSRGNGWGTQIARQAQWMARVAGRQRLVLAVDADNGPAIAAYAAVGFEAWDQRHVYFRRFDLPK